ncbi:hypothetical protein [Actinomadura sp. 9N407]|uniref:hypothetical protein n=1 Tax=Actinomadura sp. 9N407 TaxID=3375154 RepID=UPI0037A7D3AA
MTGPGTGPRRRGVWVALAIGTAVVVVLPAALWVWGMAIRRTATATDTYRRPITDVEIDGGGARVTVGPGTARPGTAQETRAAQETRVVSRLTWALSKPKVEKIWAGELLLIRFSCDGGRWVYRDLECGANIDVQVPPEVRVRVQTGSGHVSVRGITGDLRLEAGSGAVDLADVRGRIWARSSSGQISGTGLTSPLVEADVGSGRLEFGFASPPQRVKVSAGSGSVRVTVPRGSYYRVGIEAGWGAVRVDPALNDRSSPRDIVAKTGSGQVSIGYPENG